MKKQLLLVPLILLTLVACKTQGDSKRYTIAEKIENKPTIPVFFPWSKGEGGKPCSIPLFFDCDRSETPYSLVWISSGIDRDIDSLKTNVSTQQSERMRSDENTLYLISEEWHYWNPGWRNLSPDSKFYLDEEFGPHTGSEYGRTMVINFEHPDWPRFLAQKAVNFKAAGFDGMMLDWWHNGAGNGRSEQSVETARLAIAKSIREAVGEDFILLGNVNWNVDDPTAPFLSGVYLELWKSDPSHGYVPTYADEGSDENWTPSIERMEDLLGYWDANLMWPRVIAFEAWKITNDDYIADRYSEENYKYAQLFTAMVVVIPENGYVLYADNNDDWDGGDHQHAYYDFYLTDLGRATSEMVKVSDGVAYKLFEKGLVAYNRTSDEAVITIPDGREFWIGPFDGLFIEN